MMNLWEYVGLNRITVVEAQKYFDGLLEHIDMRIAEIVNLETMMVKSSADAEVPRVQITKSTGTDNRGCAYTSYQSRNTRALLYCNFPVGFVYLELYDLVPWIGKRINFSIKCGRPTYGDAGLTSIGSFMGDTYPGWENLGDTIVDRLLSSTISKDVLQAREFLVENS